MTYNFKYDPLFALPRLDIAAAIRYNGEIECYLNKLGHNVIRIGDKEAILENDPGISYSQFFEEECKAARSLLPPLYEAKLLEEKS